MSCCMQVFVVENIWIVLQIMCTAQNTSKPLSPITLLEKRREKKKSNRPVLIKKQGPAEKLEKGIFEDG